MRFPTFSSFRDRRAGSARFAEVSVPPGQGASERPRRGLTLRAFALALVFCLPAASRALAAEPVHFVVAVYGERYVIQLTEPEKIETARKMLAGTIPTPGWFLGRLAEGDGGYNRDFGSGRRWTWHFVPESIQFAEMTAEGLQALPSFIEDDKDYWLKTMGSAAIGGRIESEGLTFRPGQFVNHSARTWVGSGEDVQIVGFVLRGTAARTVLVRTAGPALAPLGVTEPLANPTLELRDAITGRLVQANDDWSSEAAKADAIAAAAQRTGALPWTRGSKDAAMLVRLEPGHYTAIARGAGAAGVALTEVYLAEDPAATRFVNLSSRAFVGPGGRVQIGGLVINGVARHNLLVRASGPALSRFGLKGVLSDPVIELHDQKTGEVIATNDNWEQQSEDGPAKEELIGATEAAGAVPFAAGSKDAALLRTVEPGIYTVVVRGGAGSTGVSLLEVFAVPEAQPVEK